MSGDRLWTPIRLGRVALSVSSEISGSEVQAEAQTLKLRQSESDVLDEEFLTSSFRTPDNIGSGLTWLNNVQCLVNILVISLRFKLLEVLVATTEYIVFLRRSRWFEYNESRIKKKEKCHF